MLLPVAAGTSKLKVFPPDPAQDEGFIKDTHSSATGVPAPQSATPGGTQGAGKVEGGTQSTTTGNDHFNGLFEFVQCTSCHHQVAAPQYHTLSSTQHLYITQTDTSKTITF